MTGQWITLVAALSGAAVGAVATFANQAAQWRRQQGTRWDATRREAYGEFLGRLDAYFLALCDLSWALRKGSPQLGARGEDALARKTEMLSAKAGTDILASDPVRQAADRLVEHLGTLEERLYAARSGHRTAPTPDLPRAAEDRAELAPVRDGFVRAVKAELAVPSR